MTTITKFPTCAENSIVLRKKWGWFLLLGILFIALGAIAAGHLFYATIAAVFYVGALMSSAGALQFFHAFSVRNWGGFLLWLASGLLYTAAGIAAFTNPAFSSVALTLVVALLIMTSGMVRLILGLRAKPEKGWGWVVASGTLTILAGLMFLIGWPFNSTWLLGLLLAIDLMFQGVALIGLAYQLGTIN
ncbi:hypothetical protein BCY90_23840 [Agrobacterium deltaense]|uniref:HdeD family acid-resistance protein n=1 Tax=Agrobacterium TaxID=357 RepID=UPI00075F3477|nr:MULTISPECIES: HdeD family acid-resistance protein [Agrobacterium]RKF36813.1 hypothetical protein BCY90_23840 [Agrobacterium deltaense]